MIDLLEKSRVTYQMPGVERNYHIFYWLLTGKYPDYAEKLLVQCDPSLYHFINQGCLEVDGIDDPEEMRIIDVSPLSYLFILPSWLIHSCDVMFTCSAAGVVRAAWFHVRGEV